MFLYLKRSLRSTWRGRLYKLSAFIECDPEELRIIQSHCFSERLAFVESLDHVADLENRAEAAYQRQKKLSVFKQEDTGKIVWENTKVLALAIRANFALASAFRVSIADLTRGTVIEAPNIVEILQTEASIQKAFDALQRIVNNAATFEQDSEAVFAPDGDDEEHLVPPSTWLRYGRR